MQENINIYDYIDFTQYLNDLFEWRSSIEKKFTKAKVCRDMGVPNSRGFFNDIVKGLRVLTNSKMESLVQIFNISDEEAQYFRLMVQYGQAQSPSEKEFYFDLLLKMNKAPKTSIDHILYYEYYKEWYHSTIRALLDVLDIEDKNEDLKLILKNLIVKIPIKKVKESIALLKKLKMVEADNSGFLRPVNPIITCNKAIHLEIIKQHQIGCLNLAVQMLQDDSKEYKALFAKTLSLSDDAFLSIKDRLQNFKEEVSSIIHKDKLPATKVYQLNMQLFAHSNKENDDV